MKNLILSVIFAVMATVSFGQNKVGFVNVDAVIASMPEYQTAQSSFNTYAESLVPANIQAKAKQAEEKYAKYQAEAATMGDARREVVEKEIMALQNEIAQFHQQNQTQQKLGQKEMELFGPVQEKAGNLISEVAKANGFTVVLNVAQTPLVYADESANMMPLIMKKLGK